MTHCKLFLTLCIVAVTYAAIDKCVMKQTINTGECQFPCNNLKLTLTQSVQIGGVFNEDDSYYVEHFLYREYQTGKPVTPLKQGPRKHFDYFNEGVPDMERLELCNPLNGTRNITIEFTLDYIFINQAEEAVLGIFTTLYIILLCILIPITLLLIVYCRKQPMRSRGALPFSTIILVILKLALVVSFNIVQTRIRDSMLCLPILMFCLHVFTQMTATIHHVRYLILVRMSKLMVDLQSKESALAKVLLRTLRVTNSVWVIMFVQFSILVVIFLAPWSIILGIKGCRTMTDDTTVIWVVYIVVFFLGYILNCISYIVITIVDGITNICAKQCTFPKLFVNNDPHMFRIEYLILTLAPIFLVPAIAILLWQTTNRSAAPKTDNAILYVFFGLITLPDMFYVLVTCGFPLIVTMIKDCRKKYQVNVGEIETMLVTDELNGLFKKFCEVEFSAENFLCYEEIVQYKKDMTLERAKKIYDTYLVALAPIEVNIQRKSANMVLKRIQEGDLKEDLFDAITKDVVINMSGKIVI